MNLFRKLLEKLSKNATSSVSGVEAPTVLKSQEVEQPSVPPVKPYHTDGSRYRVDFEGGYISFGQQDYDKALKFYKERGIRLLKCKDIFDEGTLIEGSPIFLDLSDDRHLLN